MGTFWIEWTIAYAFINILINYISYSIFFVCSIREFYNSPVNPYYEPLLMFYDKVEK